MAHRPVPASLFAAVIGSAAALGTMAVSGSEPADTLTASNRQARALLQRALVAHGGEAAIRAVRTLRLHERGQSFMRQQGPLPGRPLTPRASAARIELDFAGARGCHAPERFTHSDTPRLEQMLYVWHPRTIVRDGEVVRLNLWERKRSAPVPGGLGDLRAQQRAFPTLWLLEALEAAPTLRLVPAPGGGGGPLVGLTTADSRAVALRFAPDTGLLAAVEALSVDPVEGDLRTVTEFSAYGRTGALMLPRRRVVRTQHDVLLDVRAERLAVDEPLDESCFEIPPDFTTSVAAPPATPGPVPLADDVYLLQGLAGGAYNALAVLFADFVLMVEAPESAPATGATSQALAWARGVAGGRPVRRLAVTHFHLDHAGGIRDYVAEGVTIVTTAHNRAWVEDAARSVFAMAPDRLARAPRPPVVDVFEGDRHVIAGARQRVEIHLLPWDHAREEAFFYLPRQKLVFEGDLFASGGGEQPPVAQGSAVLLERRIRELGLDVETIVGVHGRPRPYADLRTAIEKRHERLALESTRPPS
jgi:glyoxylase-like metal-dependent hydrolase (beta-lactamase superfamily II)